MIYLKIPDYRSDNDLQTLPTDFFTNMPNLKTLQLDDNKFVTLAEDVFTWPLEHLMTFTLKGNQFRCDCRLRWLVGRRVPFDFIAECALPDSVAGTQLKYLQLKQLWC
ncbi:slit homolog 1 protein-like isoform X2 [Stegodyphus dumicola]|uniref:slit homolog 1 protein-like isoform X2 n=1 Tax=Stegodyphus dumicola TaxID=202533 RepID=UPI0015B3575F|nr:slit homolog 1 protein-like isoform X2 [Stegodyphus dumicola]